MKRGERSELLLMDLYEKVTSIRDVAVMGDRTTESVLARAVLRLAAQVAILTSEPGDLAYPARDVYGFCRRDDREAPLWTEGGLYGRVGKGSARTLLGRRKRALEMLDEVKGMIKRL